MRPEFDSLESMVLLSGLAAVGHRAHGAAMVRIEPALDVAVGLSGTARGTYHSGKALGSPVSFSGKGPVTPLGHATVKGSLQLDVQMPTGQITLTARHTRIFANLSTAGLGQPFFYTITGGTGQFAGVSGSGVASVSTVPAHGKGPAHGHFTITF
jgi:hypothetical protein